MKRLRIHTRVVILDWDGTLLNSYRADARAYQAVFRALEIKFSNRELARHYSPDWYRVYRAAKIPKKQWRLADALWGEAYRRESPRLLPGVRALLRQLNRSYVLGLVTSGDRTRVCRQLEEFGFTELFRACVCSEDAAHRKPHPAPLQKAMECMGVKAADCIYVGDTPEDIEMAHRAGVRSIGVLGPFPSSARLKAVRPGELIRSIADLPEILSPVAESSCANARGR